jgi:hypothetical protein
MRFGDALEVIWRRSVPYSRSAAYLASIAVVAAFYYHIAHHSTAYLGLLEDDHFYYTVVADNFYSTGRMTYDGATLTNGFHPLWFGVIVLLRSLTGGIGHAFYSALALVSLTAMIATYELGARYARVLGASRPLAAATAALYSLSTAQLLATGMECVIAVPLFMWWLIEIAKPAPMTPRRAAFLGFLSSLVILARLDLVIAVALALIVHAMLSRAPWRQLARRFAAFCAGGTPLALYLAANVWFFGTALPVSALAKRLGTAYGFDHRYTINVALNTHFGPTVAVVLPFGALAAWLIYRREPGLRSPALISGTIALFFAAIFFFINSLSGWILFGWYLYPLPAALIAAVVFVCRRWPLVGAARPPALAALLMLVALTPIGAAIYYEQHGPGWSISDNSMLAMSYQLADRTKQYPGLFAMGAIAGLARVAMDRPILQIEGIISDKAMVEHVRRQEPLGDVLQGYHADYLIASYAGKHPPTIEDCVYVTQPDEQWAGNRTAKMSGWICGAPVEHFFTEAGSHPYSVFPRLETFVWDLRSAHWTNSPNSPAASTRAGL